MFSLRRRLRKFVAPIEYKGSKLQIERAFVIQAALRKVKQKVLVNPQYPFYLNLISVDRLPLSSQGTVA